MEEYTSNINKLILKIYSDNCPLLKVWSDLAFPLLLIETHVLVIFLKRRKTTNVSGFLLEEVFLFFGNFENL